MNKMKLEISTERIYYLLEAAKIEHKNWENPKLTMSHTPDFYITRNKYKSIDSKCNTNTINKNRDPSTDVENPTLEMIR